MARVTARKAETDREIRVGTESGNLLLTQRGQIGGHQSWLLIWHVPGIFGKRVDFMDVLISHLNLRDPIE